MDELLKICEQSTVQELQEFSAKCSSDVNVVPDKEHLETALQVAAANGNEHVVTYLLDFGVADVNCANVYGWTPLMQASRHGHTSTALLLLGAGAKPDSKNRFGVTALTCAVRSGHVATVRALLNCGVRWSESDHDRSRDEVTPLIVAAQLGHDPILRLLLEAGCKVNHSSYSTDVTPLIMAAANGHMRTAQILIDKGADVTAVTHSGRTALDVAVINKRRQVRCFLEQKMLEIKLQETSHKKVNIFEAIQSGRLDEVQTVLSLNKAKFAEFRSVDGMTPLMFAAQLGDLGIVEALLEFGVDLDSTDDAGGWTALMFALFQGHNEIAFRLIKAGTNVNIRAHGGIVAFDIATVIGAVKPELIRCLAKETHQDFLHPLADILRQDDQPYVRPSRTPNIYASLGKTLGRFWFSKFKQGRKSAMGSEDKSATIPLNPASSLPLIPIRNARLHVRQNLATNASASFMASDWLSSSSLGSNADRTTLSIRPASPCRLKAFRKSPVHPAPPLLPSMGLDSNIAAGNIDMSLNLPFGKGAIFADGKRSLKPSANMKNAFSNKNSDETQKSIEKQTGELSAVLKKCSLEHYKFVFDKEEVDLEAFKMLTDVDLANLDIEDTSIRNRLLQVIATLNR